MWKYCMIWCKIRRKVEKIEVGEKVFFYRNYPPQGKQKSLQATRGRYIGPSLVIGTQGRNYWISFGGRCYIVAPEHIRTMVADERWASRDHSAQQLAELFRAAQATDFIEPPFSDQYSWKT